MDRLFMFEIPDVNRLCVGRLLSINPFKVGDVVVIKPVFKNIAAGEDMLNNLYDLPPKITDGVLYFDVMFVGSNTTLWPIPDINYQQWLNFIKNIKVNQK